MNLLRVWLISLALAGCASTGPKAKSGSAKSVPFVQGVHGTEAHSVSGTCTVNREAWLSMTWKRLNDVANKCVQEQKWSTVKDLGHFLAEKFYHSPWGLYYLSLYYDQAKDADRSLWFIEAALAKTAVDLGLLNYQKAKVLLSVGDLPGAYQFFEKAVRLDDNLVDAHIYLGQQAYLDRDLGRAEKHLAKAFGKNKLQEVVHFQMLAQSYEARKKWAESVDVLERGLRAHKDSLELKLQRASVLEQGLKDLRAALKAYEDVLKLQAKRSQNSSPVKDKIDQIKKLLEQNDQNERAPATREERA